MQPEGEKLFLLSLMDCLAQSDYHSGDNGYPQAAVGPRCCVRRPVPELSPLSDVLSHSVGLLEQEML